MQYAEHTPYRGYQSTVAATLHFGLGTVKTIDSIRVLFPDGQALVQKNVPTDTLLLIESKRARPVILPPKTKKELPLFARSDIQSQLRYLHEEDKQVDFKEQSLLPHQHSQLGPAMATADINGDGRKDVFIGGSAGKAGVFFIQKPDSTFAQKPWPLDSEHEDSNALFFDADADGDMDLYICSGGVVRNAQPNQYQDRLYRNDGLGNFSRDTNALPHMPTSTKAIAAADYDQDGDTDMFIGGRVTPGRYPEAPQSYLLENQNGVFKISQQASAEALNRIGMVTDALWTDFDNDNDIDLMLLGEWMPITIFENRGRQLTAEPIVLKESNAGGTP